VSPLDASMESAASARAYWVGRGAAGPARETQRVALRSSIARLLAIRRAFDLRLRFTRASFSTAILPCVAPGIRDTPHALLDQALRHVGRDAGQADVQADRRHHSQRRSVRGRPLRRTAWSAGSATFILRATSSIADW